MRFPNRSRTVTNRHAQSQKKVRSLKKNGYKRNCPIRVDIHIVGFLMRRFNYTMYDVCEDTGQFDL